MEKNFDLTLARECAAAFAASTGLGCVVSNKQGDALAEYGYGCASCRVCTLAGREKLQCVRAQNYSTAEAERFGGRYIYYCPMGLTCFVSPILGENESAAHITAGPFLMVEREDYIDCELTCLEKEQRTGIVRELESVPVVHTATVNQMSTLLFMAVGFLNKVSPTERMRKVQSADAIQGQINSYILQLKQEEWPSPYPFATEKAFLRSIRRAERLLNELLGYILLASVFCYVDVRHAHTIHLCMQYIETHYHEKVTLEQLAERLFLSPAYLSRVFKEETGTAFNDYLNRVRITKARQLLLHEELRIIDVASAVGFEDQSYFTKVFRRVTGMTPLRYRARYTQGTD